MTEPLPGFKGKNMTLHIIILAAGQGKRMYSAIPKVLHPLGGRPMLTRVIDVAQSLQPEGIHVVIGHGANQIRTELSTSSVNWVIQTEQLGTGHAVLQALAHVPLSSDVLVLYADVPLIQHATLHSLIQQSTAHHTLGLLVATLPNPSGLGRIARNAQGNIEAIIEERDATPTQRVINEIYTGICCAKAADFARWLPNLGRKNSQGEYYLTEIVGMATSEGVSITSMQALDYREIQGVNNRLQLQELERIWQQRIASELMLGGGSLWQMPLALMCAVSFRVVKMYLLM